MKPFSPFPFLCPPLPSSLSLSLSLSMSLAAHIRPSTFREQVCSSKGRGVGGGEVVVLKNTLHSIPYRLHPATPLAGFWCSCGRPATSLRVTVVMMHPNGERTRSPKKPTKGSTAATRGCADTRTHTHTRTHAHTRE
uniref:Putative secreted protein n=1 Tax=Anopheles marajoara TaxID=58244 RepID=A0A2M4C6R4_9DIPT